MTIVFWQNIISIHQSAFLRALAKKNNVILAAEKEQEGYRVQDGWKIPEIGDVKIHLISSERDAIQLLQENKEAIHVFSGIDAFPIVFSTFKSAVKSNYKVINMLEPYEWAGFKGLLRRFKYLMLSLKYGRHIHAILAMGQLGVDSYIKAGFPKEKIFQWGYFTDAKEIRSESNRPSLAQKPKLLFVGRLDENKNSKLLIETIGPLIHHIDSLSIVGDGILREEIKEKIKDTPTIKYLGVRTNDEVHSLMQEHDILVLPSSYDGWGAVVNEALQNGMHVIVSENCGANVLVDNKNRGEIFHFNSEKEGLASVLEKWIHKGILSYKKRHEIARWADKYISGTAAAQYFEEIINYLYSNSKNKPIAPWLKER